MHNISKNSVYTKGAARFSYLVYLVIKDRDLLKQDVEHSRFIGFQRGQLGHMGDRNWSTTAVCVARQPVQKLVAISEDGDVFTYAAGKAGDEVIKPTPVVLRGLGVVDGYPIACGMKRQVYRRIADDTWVEMHAPPPREGENAGFEAIAGFNINEMYAVGWNGEIWEWNGQAWLNQTSPTNLILTAVCCGDDGNVYVCGQNGTLIQGRNDSWNLVPLEDIAEDLWDLCWFERKLYLATMTSLYVMTGANVAPVHFGPDRPATCGKLTAAEGVMWSIGSDDVFSFDGKQWMRID